MEVDLFVSIIYHEAAADMKNVVEADLFVNIRYREVVA